jgi:hypothetical protein
LKSLKSTQWTQIRAIHKRKRLSLTLYKIESIVTYRQISTKIPMKMSLESQCQSINNRRILHFYSPNLLFKRTQNHQRTLCQNEPLVEGPEVPQSARSRGVVWMPLWSLKTSSKTSRVIIMMKRWTVLQTRSSTRVSRRSFPQLLGRSRKCPKRCRPGASEEVAGAQKRLKRANKGSLFRKRAKEEAKVEATERPQIRRRAKAGEAMAEANVKTQNQRITAS